MKSLDLQWVGVTITICINYPAPITAMNLLKVKLDNQWVQAAGHYLSQWKRDRIDSYMTIDSINAAEWENSRSPTKVCCTLLPLTIQDTPPLHNPAAYLG